MRIASLPMYDAHPQAVDAWWRAIARALRARGVADVPDSLHGPSDPGAHWRDPRLLLSQACGYPLVTSLAPHVQVVGAFRYGAPGCDGIDYRSELVARVGDADAIEGFRGRVAAINALDSHSGCNALRGLVAPLARDGAFFGDHAITGSHRRSLAAVQSGAADVAAIDCVTLAGLRISHPDLLHGLRVVGSTAAAPGLPLVTSATTSPDDLAALRDALHAACTDPAAAEARDALFIEGFEVVPAQAWQVIDDVRASAQGSGTGSWSRGAFAP